MSARAGGPARPGGPAYRVRPAARSDLPDLGRMRRDWSGAMDMSGTPSAPEADGAGASSDGDMFDRRMAAWWDRQAGARHAWLGLAGDEAVAMANAMVFERMPRPGVPDARWVYVANVWVDPAHRRRGLATLLMTSVLDWAQAERMGRVVLNPSAMALRMYSALGFRPADDLMRLDLSDRR